MLKRPLFLQRSSLVLPIFVAALAMSACSTGPAVQRNPGLVDPLILSRQMIVVTTPSWDSLAGTLTTYERDDEKGDWRIVGGPIAMSLGNKGLAWGTGLHGWTLGEGPVKKEGDKKAPAGVFALPAIYGYAPADQAREFAMPYIPLDSTMVCVDDPTSQYYNMIVSKKNVPAIDWKSAERMRGNGPWYRWGVVVASNQDPRIPGDGSCIFLHVWGYPYEPTSGCSTITEEELVKILTWLRPNAHPVLVQLPQAEYERRRAGWKLP